MATCFIRMSKVRHYIAACRFLQICIAWNLLRTFHLGDTCMTLFVDRQLGSFPTENIMVLDMTVNGTVYGEQARSDDYLNLERLSLIPGF